MNSSFCVTSNTGVIILESLQTVVVGGDSEYGPRLSNSAVMALEYELCCLIQMEQAKILATIGRDQTAAGASTAKPVRPEGTI